MQPVGHLEKVRALAVSSRTLAVAGVRVGTTSHLTLYNHLSEKPERSLDLPAHVLALAASDDRVVAACADGHLRVFGTKKGDLLLDIAAHQGAATSVATRGEVVASVGTDGALRVFSLDDGTRHHEWPLSSGPLRAVAIDAEAFAAAGDDGVVRVVWSNGAPTRVMPGHEGAVSCLAFTPSDGRLVSGGEDGTVRLWYLVGDIEADIRGKDESGHAGGVTGLLFPPEKDASQLGARIVSVGLDGKLRVWRTAERRKPRTIEVGSEGLYAVALARSTKPDTLGTLFASGDARTVTGIPLDAEGAPSDRVVRYAHGFSVLSEALGAQARPKREAAVKTLVTLGETEALELALRALSSDKDPEVRALTASELATHGRREARKGLRDRLDDGHATVRSAALAALRKLEPDTPLSPLRAALASRHPDVRIAALQLLAPLFATSPVAAAMIAAHLTDGNAGVRQMALAQLVAIAPPGSSEPLRTAFERGTADVRAEVLVRGAMTGLTLAGDFAPLVGKALDDEDAEVRRVAFVVTAVAHPSLGAWLQSKDEEFGRALSDVTRRVATLQGATGATGEPTADSLEAARVRLLGALAGRALTEEDREPLLASLACRTADTTLRGARGLALLGDMRALGALLTISRDSSAGLRRDAALALVALDDPRARRRLAWMMSDADASVRDAALGCFTRLEPDALSVAEAALHASAEDMRVRGLDVLVKQGKGVARAEELLAASLEDEAPKVRSEAFRTLWAWHDAEPLGPLDRALTARFPDLRGRAVEELAALSLKPGGPLAAPSLTRLAQTVADRDATVALAAYEATLKVKGDADSDTHLAAMASTHPSMRTRGAKDSAKAPVDKVRSALSKLLDDTEEPVRIAAIEALDKLLPTEAGPLRIGLQSSHLDLRVRAAELLAVRRDEQLIDPMCALLADKELLKRLPLAIIVPLRQRASTSLASLGSPRLLKYFATDLIKDDDGVVREQASRGVSNASRRGEEGYLLDLLGHTELAIRSWAAEGLARLGDVRALPVLTGTLRHEHAPIRVGAVLSFAALGPEGFGGMLQGLEDPSREVQRIVLSIVLARDLRAFRHGEPPDLLASALSSQRPEVRFAAARAIELRIDPELYMGHLVEMLMPDKPEKASELAKWPNEETRARSMVGLADALAGDRPEQRYAAAQALRLRDRPLDYFREVQRAARLRSVASPWVPETTPRAPEPPPETPSKGPLSVLRSLFAGDTAAKEPSKLSAEDQKRLRELAFGAYVGLLRETAAEDEANRVRRDAIERIVALTSEGYVSLASATPSLARALDDPSHLVRRAAFSALQRVAASTPEVALTLALSSTAADVVRAALDDLATRGETARIAKALDSKVAEARKYAFELLEKLSPKGSLDPLLAAIGSEHADMRLGVLERLSTSRDPRVLAALGKALESDHEDLRLRAAEMLAARKDDRAVDVLAASMRSDDAATAQRARDALARLGTAAAVRAIAARLDDGVEAKERGSLVEALAAVRIVEAIDVLALRFNDEDAQVRSAAMSACLTIVGPRSDTKRQRGAAPVAPRNTPFARRAFEGAVRSRYVDMRRTAAGELDDLDDAVADVLLSSLFGDRDGSVRVVAVASYAKRVEKRGAATDLLEAVLRAGARETLLAAAEGLATKKVGTAFRALLLFARAGGPGERERALLALGTLGDPRALAELEVIASGGTEEAPAEVPMQAAALEALGRLFGKLEDAEVRERVRERIEGSVGAKVGELAAAAVKALRYVGGERARARIEAVLDANSSSYDERRAAAVALGEMGDVAAEQVLGRALNTSPEDVRWAARESLEKLFPKEQTRIEFLAVGSDYDDMSGPAAAFLASEGDAGQLLARLAKLSDESLRERIRFGLARREKVPTDDMVKLLAVDSPEARADAAWLAGVRASVTPEGDCVRLGAALIEAALRAEREHAKPDGAEREANAWLRALWAAREIAPGATRKEARRMVVKTEVPSLVRVEAVHALAAGGPQDTATLRNLLVDTDTAVRAAAASALVGAVPSVLDFRASPFDPVLLGQIAGDASAALVSTEGRRVFLGRALGRQERQELVDLATLARTGTGQDRLDAFAALGRGGGTTAMEVLSAIAFAKGRETADVKKAAYRALRRAQRMESQKEARS